MYPKKEKRYPFNIGFFTPGTVCLIKVDCVHKEPIQVNVVRLILIDGANFLIETDLVNEHTGVEAYNVCYCVGVVKHVPGKLVIYRPNEKEWSADHFKDDARKEFPHIKKHPSQYLTNSPEQLVRWLSMEYRSKDGISDYKALTDALMVDTAPLFKEQFIHSSVYDRIRDHKSLICTIYSVNKKKLKQRIKQSINRSLLTYKAEEKANKEMWDEIYASENDREMDSDIYDVAKNKHGFSQTMQRDPDGDYPVCSQCSAMVEENTGQGDACTKCNAECDMHFEHDFY
jgi:hypothetical protein